ncbi:MAG TPA: hypothetical protein P5528_00145 [Steroidobacteraceae bacterium]|nr:hypothetical protein [Steroidobacteraceae bacterium]HRX87827.1 hypothetical protein [Steroidobacteraceae bacterium]
MQSRRVQLADRRGALVREGATLRRELRPAIEGLTSKLTSRRGFGTAARLFAKDPARAGLVGLAAWSALRARRYPWMQIARWLVAGFQLVRLIRGQRPFSKRI